MENGVLVLAVSGALVVLLTAVLYHLEQKLKIEENGNSRKWSIIVGIIYACVAILSTEKGIPIDGAMMNIRDAAPLCAGLFFGAPAGLIAGFIGGIERWVAVAWGIGSYTRLACSLGTIFAGLIAAFARKYIFENRKPHWIYALAIGTATEVMHMLLVFTTNLDGIPKALSVVTTCSGVMIPMVAVTVALASVTLSIISDGENEVKSGQRAIAEQIQAGLLVSVLIAFVLTNTFIMLIQKSLSYETSGQIINQTLEDAKLDIQECGLEGAELEAFIKDDIANWHIAREGYLVAINEQNQVVAYSKGVLHEVYGHSINPDDYELIMNTVGRITVSGSDYYASMIEFKGYKIAGLYSVEEAELGKNVSTITTSFFEIIILAVLFFQIIILIRSVVVKDLKTINSDLSRISSGNLNTVVDVHTSREFASLSEDINSTVDTLKHYIAEASARIDAELAFARDIQSSALPRVYPETDKIDLYANMLAAKEVGGDFYDFYSIGENKIALLIADVSGKGIPAALFMMKSKALIKSLVELGLSPADAFYKANNELCEGNAGELFVTAWLGIIDCDTGIVTYANAGHNEPVLGVARTGKSHFVSGRRGLVLAGMEGMHYTNNTLQMEPGDGLLLYTDGVTEATNINNELFGEERLLKSIDEVKSINMRYLCKAVKASVDEFVGEAPQFDDITMLAIRYNDIGRTQINVELTAEPDSINVLNEHIERFVEDQGISTKMFRRMSIVVDELYSNIIKYSGARSANVCIQHREGLVGMTFKDDGVAYDPTAKLDPDLTLSAEERNIGGLGIFMVKEMADDVKYGRINNRNVLDVILKE